MDVIKPNDAFATEILLMIQHDFKNAQRRKLLLSKNDQLFLDKRIYEQCIFIRHLQMKTLWKYKGADQLTEDDKEQLWNMLLSFWLIAQTTLLLPEDVCNKIQELAIVKGQQMTQSTQPFDIHSVSAECKTIIYAVKGPHFRAILKWVERFTFAPYTPFIDLLPDEYAGLGASLHSIIKDDTYREVIMKNAIPVMTQVKTSAQQRGINLQFDEEEEEMEQKSDVASQRTDDSKSTQLVSTSNQYLDDEGDTYDYENPDNVQDAEEDIAQVSNDEMRRVGYVIDTIFKILDSHSADLKKVMEDPKMLVSVLSNPNQLKNIANTLEKELKSN